MIQRYDVVIPAGGRIAGEYQKQAGTALRALAPVGPDKIPVLQIVVNALRSSGRAGNIVVSGETALKGCISGVDGWTLTKDESDGPSNILRGLAELPPDRPAMVCTSDLPFLSGDAVADFADHIAGGAEITAGVVSAQDYLRQYPDAPPSQFVMLRETGPITMSCLFGVVPGVVPARRDLLARAFAARKSQLRMASILGAKLVFELMMSRLSLASIRKRLSVLMHCDVHVVANLRPELAYDIDTVEDYLYLSSR